jgi:hypothetical protein
MKDKLHFLFNEYVKFLGNRITTRYLISVLDPKIFVTDPDLDPDPTFQIVSDPDVTFKMLRIRFRARPYDL